MALTQALDNVHHMPTPKSKAWRGDVRHKSTGTRLSAQLVATKGGIVEGSVFSVGHGRGYCGRGEDKISVVKHSSARNVWVEVGVDLMEVLS